MFIDSICNLQKSYISINVANFEVFYKSKVAVEKINDFNQNLIYPSALLLSDRLIRIAVDDQGGVLEMLAI